MEQKSGKSQLIEIGGWLGAVMLLVAYGLLAGGKLTGLSVEYQSLNAVAAVLLGINAVAHRAYPLVGINVVWFAIAVYSLW